MISLQQENKLPLAEIGFVVSHTGYDRKVAATAHRAAVEREPSTPNSSNRRLLPVEDRVGVLATDYTESGTGRCSVRSAPTPSQADTDRVGHESVRVNGSTPSSVTSTVPSLLAP